MGTSVSRVELYDLESVFLTWTEVKVTSFPFAKPIITYS